VPEAPEKPEAIEAPEALEPLEIDEVPQVPVPPAIVLQDCLNKKGFCITVVDNYGECVVIIKDKNNKIVEAVTLTDWNKDKLYEDKYGEIPPRKVNVIIKQGFKAKPVTLVNLKPVTIVQVKPATSINIKLKPTPVKVINSNRINKAETKPFSDVNSSPVAAVQIQRVEATSAVKVTSAVSAKSAVKVQVAAESNVPKKPVARLEAKSVDTVNIAALYPGVSGGENIIATNKPLVIVKLSRDKKTVTKVIRDPL
jgi:hypothetical protein